MRGDVIYGSSATSGLWQGRDVQTEDARYDDVIYGANGHL
jgi:hypothetical protein